jgi:hypothetical protein
LKGFSDSLSSPTTGEGGNHGCEGDFGKEVCCETERRRRLVERFEWHYTPKHGSWLDLAECELGVLTSQCLDRRIPNKQILIDEIAAWVHDRNANHTKADWQFTTKNARIKLKHLYPAI